MDWEKKMKLQDVIKVVETERECVGRDCDRDCGKCDLVMDRDIILEAYDEVLKSLNSKECITPYIDIDEAKCPVCKVRLTRQELLGDDVLFEDFFEFCPDCGRKVEWQ